MIIILNAVLVFASGIAILAGVLYGVGAIWGWAWQKDRERNGWTIR